jgi:hypothetical protein
MTNTDHASDFRIKTMSTILDHKWHAVTKYFSLVRDPLRRFVQRSKTSSDSKFRSHGNHKECNFSSSLKCDCKSFYF